MMLDMAKVEFNILLSGMMAIGWAMESGRRGYRSSSGIRAHYKQLSEFERDRIIGLKDAGWANWRIARHMSRSDVAIRKCWQEWVDNGRFQRRDGSGRPKATADREDRLTVRSTVIALDSSLSAIRRATRTPVSTMTIHS
ncbi:HTH_Tnp_Tc3_2 domain-containing protein [Trichonephila clavipes]|nr:HTH_Tnp_Tc3_2 domain-containing protein [Trichonephila clavipes]